tara:strand:- start:17287 stop:17517 length:231 start_codon:yes stop_codon:yes gene_type:complete
MNTKQIELNLNETGFLCNMIMGAYLKTNPPIDKDGNIPMPEWLHNLYQKLAVANDQMMAEEDPTPQLILPPHLKKH